MKQPTPVREAQSPMIQSGYCPVYRKDETNYCPGCGRTHWYIGRFSAQCAFCETAIPLKEAA